MPTISHNPSNESPINWNIYARANSPRGTIGGNGQNSVLNTGNSSMRKHRFLLCCRPSWTMDLDVEISNGAIARTAVILFCLLSIFAIYSSIFIGLSVLMALMVKTVIVITLFMLCFWIFWLICTIGMGYLICASIFILIRQIAQKRRNGRRITVSHMNKPITTGIPSPPDAVLTPLTPSKPIPYNTNLKEWNMQTLDVSYEFVDKYLEIESLEKRAAKSASHPTAIGSSSSCNGNQPDMAETGQTENSVYASSMQDGIEEETNTYSILAMDDITSIRSTTHSEESASNVTSKLDCKEKEINNSSGVLYKSRYMDARERKENI